MCTKIPDTEILSANQHHHLQQLLAVYKRKTQEIERCWFSMGCGMYINSSYVSVPSRLNYITKEIALATSQITSHEIN